MRIVKQSSWALALCVLGGALSSVANAQNPTFFTQRPGFAEAEKARDDRLKNVTPIHGDLPDASLKGKADVAFTAQNLHDIYNSAGEDAAVALCKGVYEDLKPGGTFIVIDHVGIAGQDNKMFHRIELAQAKAVLTKAGFKIDAESDLLKNPKDDHTKGVRDPSVAGHTDQFLIRAKK